MRILRKSSSARTVMGAAAVGQAGRGEPGRLADWQAGNQAGAQHREEMVKAAAAVAAPASESETLASVLECCQPFINFQFATRVIAV